MIDEDYSKDLEGNFKWRFLLCLVGLKSRRMETRKGETRMDGAFTLWLGIKGYENKKGEDKV